MGSCKDKTWQSFKMHWTHLWRELRMPYECSNLAWSFVVAFHSLRLPVTAWRAQSDCIQFHLWYTLYTKGMPTYLIMPPFAVFYRGLAAPKVCWHLSKTLSLLVSWNFLSWNLNFRARIQTLFQQLSLEPWRIPILFLAPFLLSIQSIVCTKKYTSFLHKINSHICCPQNPPVLRKSGTLNFCKSDFLSMDCPHCHLNRQDREAVQDSNGLQKQQTQLQQTQQYLVVFWFVFFSLLGEDLDGMG